MRMFNYCRVLIVLTFALCFSGMAGASTVYYWQLQNYPSNGEFSSAQDACDSRALITHTNPEQWLTNVTTTSAQCWRKSFQSPTAVSQGMIYRQTRTCPYGNTGLVCNDSCAGTMTDGQCVLPPPNPCASKSGQDKAFTKTGSVGDGYAVAAGKYIAYGGSGCSGGCAISIPVGGQTCRGKVSGVYACKGTGQFTGQQCEASPGDFDDVPPETPLPPVEYSDNQPCNYVSNPDGTQSCSSVNTKGKQGQYCGSVNGVQTCVNTPPTENGIKIDTTVKTTPNSDGSATTVKTDTATTTTCSGVNSCTSSSTVITTTTTSDSAGKTVSVSGTCDGAQCPDKNTNPDGDGDGLGDCVGDDCGVGGGVGGIQTPELDEEVPGFGETLQAFMSDLEQAPIIASLSGITVPSGGSFPTGSVSLPFGTFDFNIVADLAPTILNPMRYVFLALWAWGAIRLLFTA